MKTKIIFILLGIVCLADFSKAQGSDTLMPTVKYQKAFPGLVLGWNRVGFSTAEAAFIIGLTNNKMKQTKMMSMIMHGPSFGCLAGKYENAFRIAPKFSYEYYTSFLGGRLSLIDFMKNDAHNLYVSPEVGFSGGSLLNIFAGANIPVSGEELPEVKTFHLSITIDLLFFYFGKDKSGKTN